jgi:hypothetical protein
LERDWEDTMTDTLSLLEAVEQRGPYAVWTLMSEDERRAAAVALWEGADRDSRAALEVALAKDLKFRPQSVRHLGADRVASRLVRLAEELPEAVLFQYLFHLHMGARRPLMVRFLDAVGLPHEDGALAGRCGRPRGPGLPRDPEGRRRRVLGRARAGAQRVQSRWSCLRLILNFEF